MKKNKKAETVFSLSQLFIRYGRKLVGARKKYFLILQKCDVRVLNTIFVEHQFLINRVMVKSE
jgi:hypothetical protein